MILNRDPFCQACGRSPSKHVDHIKPKHLGGSDHQDNLQGLCGPCHDAKTNREAKAAARQKVSMSGTLVHSRLQGPQPIRLPRGFKLPY